MNIEVFWAYCFNKLGVEEIFFFGLDILVFKVMGKIFVVIGLDEEAFWVNFKCDLEWV